MSAPTFGDEKAPVAADDWTARLFSLAGEDPELSIKALSALVREHPSRADALLALAVALTRANRTAHAAEALRRARFLEPELAIRLPRPTPGVEPTEAQLIEALTSFSGPHSQAEVRETERLEQIAELARSDTRTSLAVLAAEPVVAPSLPLRVPTPVLERPDPVEKEVSRELVRQDDATAAVFQSPAIVGELLDHPPVELPDGWMLARLSLELWIRRFSAWAAPLIATNLFAAFAADAESPALVQALLWLVALAVGAPITLWGMAREWEGQVENGKAVSRRNTALVWVPALLLIICGLASTLLALRLAIGGEELLALGMLVSLPPLALLAPALMTWITGRGGLKTGLQVARVAFTRRSVAHVAVMGVIGGFGGVVLAVLGWGFLVTLNLIDARWLRIVQAIMMSLPESLLLALVATIGLDALAARDAQEVNPARGERVADALGT